MKNKSKIIGVSILLASTLTMIGCGTTVKNNDNNKDQEPKKEVTKEVVKQEPKITDNNKKEENVQKPKKSISKYYNVTVKKSLSGYKNLENYEYSKDKDNVYVYNMLEGVTDHKVESTLDEFKMDLAKTKYGVINDKILYATGEEQEGKYHAKAYMLVGQNEGLNSYLSLDFISTKPITKEIVKQVLSQEYVELKDK